MARFTLKNLSEDRLEAVAARFRCLGEVSRLKIIQELQNGEKNVNELVELTGLSQPNVSRHLSILINCGLIGRRKDGLNVIYKIRDKSLAETCSIVCRSVCKE